VNNITQHVVAQYIVSGDRGRAADLGITSQPRELEPEEVAILHPVPVMAAN